MPPLHSEETNGRPAGVSPDVVFAWFREKLRGLLLLGNFYVPLQPCLCLHTYFTTHVARKIHTRAPRGRGREAVLPDAHTSYACKLPVMMPYTRCWSGNNKTSYDIPFSGDRLTDSIQPRAQALTL